MPPARSSSNPVDFGNLAPAGQNQYRATKKCTITDLVSGEVLALQYNPETLDLALRVAYEAIKVPGLSWQPLQYGGTENQDIQIDVASLSNTPTESQSARRALAFLHSLCYPRAAADSVVTGAPCRVLFVWPNLLSLTCRLKELSTKVSRFAQDGSLLDFVAHLTLAEVGDVNILAEDVVNTGFWRTAQVQFGGDQYRVDDAPPEPAAEGEV